MRVHHYIKNLLIFMALSYSGQLLENAKLKNGILGFISFCAISSAVYIINDIQDKEKDKLHPQKCNRLIASGDISVKNATFYSIALVLIGILCNVLVFHFLSSMLLLLYLIINLAYSYGLKNIPIADVSILALGFFIRIAYGAIITDINISNWLCLTVISLAFYFALGKRRNELRLTKEGETRNVLKYYSKDFLDKNMYMCLTLANMFYALWSMEKSIVASYDNRNFIFTVPMVLIITMKYSLDIEGDFYGGDPVEVFIHDKILILLCVLYIAVMFTIIYI